MINDRCSAVSGKIRGDPKQRRHGIAFQEKLRELKKENAYWRMLTYQKEDGKEMADETKQITLS